ncbi:helix-turn-helix transcriptional regulator [Saccharopolyspora sp. HNM0986]|uniref:helix-turn-helix domain-containing protein n=1 Tax=Saccharopolyspora galaxeae TaxID=2781241 RepID=UPI00190A78C1|nr:helix-turn-helix transcriptional regulator [Saccharopolyspora sp. HNM0986]MBK0867507.1 helix-turn-helix transcriptional regulator [Saccharopolyspora sp. HNM0986]
MARRVGPSARSRRLAQSLRKIRTENGASAAEVGKALGMSGSKLNRIETCEIGIYLDDLEKLLDFYQVAKLRRVELLDIARHAEQRSWLRTRNAHFPADWQTWSDFEDEATALRYYEPMMIPGLLQTPEYARAVIAATDCSLTDREVDELVSSRVAKRGLLTGAKPLELHVIVEEAALQRPFGEPDCRTRQIRHLMQEAELPNVTLQVLAPDAGLHVGMTGAFILVEYGAELGSVWLEQMVSSICLEEREHLEVYRTAWENLVKTALSTEGSLDRLRQLVVQLG